MAKMKSGSVAYSYQLHKQTHNHIVCLLSLSPPFLLPSQLPMANLHAAIGGCSEGDSDSGCGVKNGGC